MGPKINLVELTWCNLASCRRNGSNCGEGRNRLVLVAISTRDNFFFKVTINQGDVLVNIAINRVGGTSLTWVHVHHQLHHEWLMVYIIIAREQHGLIEIIARIAKRTT